MFIGLYTSLYDIFFWYYCLNAENVHIIIIIILLSFNKILQQ